MKFKLIQKKIQIQNDNVIIQEIFKHIIVCEVNAKYTGKNSKRELHIVDFSIIKKK